MNGLAVALCLSWTLARAALPATEVVQATPAQADFARPALPASSPGIAGITQFAHPASSPGAAAGDRAVEALEWYSHRLNAANAGMDGAGALAEVAGNPQQSLRSALPLSRQPPVAGAQAPPACADNPLWVDRLGDTCEAYKALRYLCEDKMYGAAAKENCKRSCGQCEIDVPESLLVLSPTGHQEKSGIYALVKGRLVNGLPLWRREDGTKAFIFSGLNGNWLLGGEKEEAQDFRTNAGWFYAYSRHGSMPHQLGGAWWRFDGGRWIHDTSIEISPYQAAGAFSTQGMDGTAYACVLAVTGATAAVMVLLAGAYCRAGGAQRGADEAEAQDSSMTGCFLLLFAFTATGFGGLWYLGLIQPMWQTLLVIVYGVVAAGWFVGLLLIQASRKLASKRDADAEIAKGVSILGIPGKLNFDPDACAYDVEGPAPRKKVCGRACDDEH